MRLLPQLRQHEGKWRGAGELLGTGRVGPERGRGGCLALVRFVGPRFRACRCPTSGDLPAAHQYAVLASLSLQYEASIVIPVCTTKCHASRHE